MSSASKPWGDDLVERYNVETPADILDKVLEGTNFDLVSTHAWCVDANSSLSFAQSFSLEISHWY